MTESRKPFIIRFKTVEKDDRSGKKARVVTLAEIVDSDKKEIKYFVTMCHEGDKHVKKLSIEMIHSKIMEGTPYDVIPYDPSAPFGHRAYTASLAATIQVAPEAARCLIGLLKRVKRAKSVATPKQ